MNSLSISLTVLFCIFLGTLIGTVIRELLPEHHLGDHSRDVMKLGAGLIATMSALVLGLLISTAKSQFDSVNDQLIEGASARVLLDRNLAHYGPETAPLRLELRQAFEQRIKNLWPKDKSVKEGIEAEEQSTAMESVGDGLRLLQPHDENQQILKARLMQLFTEGIGKTAWSLWALE